MPRKKIPPVKVPITAADKITAPINKISKKLEALTAPIKKVQAAFGRLSNASGLGKMGAALGKAGGAVRNFGAAAFGAFVKLGAIIGGVTIAVFKLIESTANMGDNLAKTSKILGTSAENLQKYRHAAKLSGLESAEFDKGLQLLARNSAEAAKGLGIAKRDFDALDISTKGANGKVKDSTKLLLEIAEKFKGIDDPARKVGMAMNIFGRSGAKMINLLNEGPDAIKAMGNEMVRLGLITNEEAVASEKFKDAQLRVETAITGLKIKLTTALLPAITKLQDKFTEFVVKQGPAIKKFAKEFAAKLPDRLRMLRDKLLAVKEALQPFIDAVVGAIKIMGPFNTIVIVLASIVIPGLIIALGGLVVAFYSLGVAIMTTPVGWIMLAIVALIAVVVIAVKWGKRIVQFFIDMGANILLLFGPIGWFIRMIIFIVKNFDILKSAGKQTFEGLLDVIKTFVKSGPVAALKLLFEGAKKFFSKTKKFFIGSEENSTQDINHTADGAGLFDGIENNYKPVNNTADFYSKNSGKTSTITNESKVKIEFDNLPDGAKVRTDSGGNDLDVVNRGASFAF